MQLATIRIQSMSALAWLCTTALACGADAVGDEYGSAAPSSPSDTSDDADDSSDTSGASSGPDDGDTGGSGDDSNIGCTPGVGDCPSTEKCQPYIKEDGACCVDAVMCVPVTGSRQLGETCTRERYGDDCDKDLFCFAGTSGAEGLGKCKQLCNVDNEASCDALEHDRALCVPYNNGLLPVCEIECDPQAPDCPEGLECQWSGSRFVCGEPGEVPGNPDGSDCSVGLCDPGLVCQPAARQHGCDYDHCCTPYCDLGANDTICSAPELCVSFESENGSDVGFCGIE